jgi:RHS repeat-associated protein
VQYWIAIHDNTTGYSGTFRREQSSTGDGLFAYNYNSTGWSPTGGDLAFELELSSGAPLSANPFLFMGRRTDAESGLTRSGSRNVNHRAGRFVERDGVDWWRYGVEHGNAFTFATNNPTSTIDLTDTIASWPTVDDDESTLSLLQDPPPRIQENPRPQCHGECEAAVVNIMILGDRPPNAYTDDEISAALSMATMWAFKLRDEFEAELNFAADTHCAQKNVRRCVCNGSMKYIESTFAFELNEEMIFFDGKGEPVIKKIPKAAIFYGYYMEGECDRPPW